MSDEGLTVFDSRTRIEDIAQRIPVTGLPVFDNITALPELEDLTGHDLDSIDGCAKCRELSDA